MRKDLNYCDVILTPEYSNLKSRRDANTTVHLGEKRFKLPVIPANMQCCIDYDLAAWMSENEFFYILHRFYNYNDIYDWINISQTLKTISVSVGVKLLDRQLLQKIVENNLRIDYITIDIAHGDNLLMQEMIGFIHELYKNKKRPFIIGGNIASIEAAHHLQKWGADCAKVGIAMGLSCITKIKTGFASPMFSTIYNICNPDGENYYPQIDFPIIADGGIRENGDITKALVAGAKMVMCGSIFSACKDSPANYDAGRNVKFYYGSASKHCNNKTRNIEGKLIEIPCNNMTYEQKLQEIKEDLTSSISYAGGYNLNDLKDFPKEKIIILK